MANLYYIEQVIDDDPEFVIADSIQEAIVKYRAFKDKTGDISGRYTDIDEPEVIKLITDHVI